MQEIREEAPGSSGSEAKHKRLKIKIKTGPEAAATSTGRRGRPGDDDSFAATPMLDFRFVPV